MSRSRRRLATLPLAMLAAIAVAATASAHPLGNYTVNRAVSVEITAGTVELAYIVDMAEIPTFSELQAIDANGDGTADAAERAHYAAGACATDLGALTLSVDRAAVRLRPAGEPALSFPAGAGGLETLRLVCQYRSPLSVASGSHRLEVSDHTNDGHIGWREVTIRAGAGAAIVSADVPQQSASADLTHYPIDALQTPPDVRSGTATLRITAGGTGGVAAGTGVPAAPDQRVTASDPLASLIAGQGSGPVALLAVLLAMGLGAAHALSPGHGKALVAAYLIGSSGSRRQAATLGLTVAATHTAGVFLLGAATLLVGQFLVPERVIGWLTLGSGVLVVLLGVGLVIRAIRARMAPQPHGHDHAHGHPHAHPHHRSGDGPPNEHAVPTLRARNVVVLGLAGGMVPSTSALIVLLVAVTTNQLLFGLGLIVAFGIGMALVLGGLALATTLARSRLSASGRLRSHPQLRRAAAMLPLASGIAVLAAGLAVTIGAAVRFA